MQFKPFDNEAFEKFVNKEYETNPHEIFSVEFEGEKYWVKKGRKTSSNLFHHLCYKLLPFEFLIPVENKTAKESILFESNKLIEFKAKGIHVPDVIGSNEKFFVMSDCGLTMYHYLKYGNPTKKEFNDYLNLYLYELCKIHNSASFHGGAQSRNFTYFDNRVFAIDLEDSFSSIDIETLQFRDLLLLLLSMTKIDNHDISYKDIIIKYISLTNNENFIKKFKQLSIKLSFLTKLNSIDSIHKILPRDAKNFCKLLLELQKL